MSSLFGSRFGNRPKTEEKPTPPTPPQALQVTSRPSALTQQPLGFETLLGPSSVLEGKLKSDGNIRLDGTFTGTLEISGNVLVGETANIHADIDAKNISIAGAVRGNVTGNKIQLLRTGRVWGDISATALTTEEGAFIDGKISMKMTPPVEPVAPPVEPVAPPPAEDKIQPEDSAQDEASTDETQTDEAPTDEIPLPEGMTDTDETTGDAADTADSDDSDIPKESKESTE